MKEEKYPERFSTREAIARYLGITRMTLYRWSKVIPLTTYAGRHVWLDSNEVNAWHKKVRAEEHRLFMKRIT